MTTTSGVNVSGFDFGEFQTVTLSGEVYNDFNGNGVLDNGEPGLAGWTIDLYRNGYGFIASTTTDSSGDYAFTGVGPGTYILEEVSQSGYIQTSSPSDYSVTTSNAQNVANLDFGEFQTVTLSGEAFNDLNGNGVLDGGEPGLAGWTIDLLNSSNQVINSTTTDSNGDYLFTAVGPGTFTIKEVSQSGSS